jgi:hypothetical protein
MGPKRKENVLFPEEEGKLFLADLTNHAAAPNVRFTQKKQPVPLYFR